MADPILQLAKLAAERGLIIARTRVSAHSILLGGDVTRFYLPRVVVTAGLRFDGYVGYSRTDIRKCGAWSEYP